MEDLLKEVLFIVKKMDVKLFLFFEYLFCMFYGVVLVFDNIVFKYIIGCYIYFSGDDKFGYYWVNIYVLDKCLLYVLFVFILYEVVFGYYL